MNRYVKIGGALAAIVLALAATMLWPRLEAATGVSAWQQQWLVAEGESNLPVAIKHWEALYAEIKGDDAAIIAPGVTGGDVRKQLFSAYLKHAKETQSSPYLNEAGKMLDDVTPLYRAWGYVLIAKAAASIDKKTAMQYLRKLDQLIPEISAAEQRNRLAHGLVMAALAEEDNQLVHHWDGLELADRWIPHIAIMPHRAEVMHQLALVDHRDKTELGAQLATLLRIPLNKGKERHQQLIALHQQALGQGQFQLALDALTGIADGSAQQKQLYDFFRQQWKAEEYSRAESIAQRISDGKFAAMAWGELAVHFSRIGQEKRAKDAAELSYELADKTGKSDRRVEALLTSAEHLAGSGDIEKALTVLKMAQDLEDPKPFAARVDKLRYAISKAYAVDKDISKAEGMASEIDDQELRKKAKDYVKKRQAPAKKKKKISDAEAAALEKKLESIANQSMDKATDDAIEQLAIYFVEKGEKKKAAYTARKMQEPMRRTLLFRQIAETMAQQTDYYGILGTGKEQLLTTDSTLSEYLKQVDASEVEKWEDSVALGSNRKIRIQSAPASKLGKELPDFLFPERLKYNVEYVRAMIPQASPFKIARSYYQNNFFVNTKFKLAIDQSEGVKLERSITPEVLYLASGTATLPQLYDALLADGMGEFLHRQGAIYTLRRPLVVGPKATLIIDGSEVGTLRQTREHSVIIINAGNLFVIDSKIVGWSEREQKVLRATYNDRYAFRPFLASFSNSHTYVAGNELLGLGYNNHKSYGLSYSEGPGKMVGGTIYHGERPDGIVADNSFDNTYYGFYSYEADHVTLIGNEYRDNIVYGIDPHDRSRWLTIAYNTAYGVEKKHGIIISREVNDSNYVGNLSFDNHGSGFMIDRLSIGTYVYGNTAFDNDQDGLTLFESSCNLVASNHFFHNKSMGIRVRNAQDNGLFYNYLNENKQGGIYAYTSELLDDPAHVKRNFGMDPYADVAAASMVGNHIENNGMGLVFDNVSALVLRENTFVNQSPRIIQGTWLDGYPHLTSQYDLQKGIYVDEACPSGKWIPRKCRFRQNGDFMGDGQQHLEQRVTKSSCQQPSRQDQL